LAKSKRSSVVLVGGGSLLGRELREMLARLPNIELRLTGTDEDESGTLTEVGGEPLVMTALDEENLSAASVVILTGSPASGQKALEILSRSKRPARVIDLTYTLEENPQARLRAPMVEPERSDAGTGSIFVVAHPAAIVLARFLERLNRNFPLRRSVVHVFEPASERGKRGIGELQQQSVNLLAFKKLPKAIFDEQIAFNMLSRYGEDAPESLESIEERIERHLASLLAASSQAPMPSLRVIQVPVFHGHSFSAWVEFEQAPAVPALEQALAAADIDIRGAGAEAPTNVGMAGQTGMAIGRVAADRNDPRAAWFWMAVDNFQITAENALAIVQSLLAPAGIGTPE
jgi:aspartate-semialdehyde dehydrogenase